MSNFTISPSPHVHGGDSIEKNMYGVLIALVPTFIFSVVFFGLGAILVTLTSVAACLVFEYVIQKYLMKQRPTIWDGSAIITGVLLAFNLPSGNLYEKTNCKHRAFARNVPDIAADSGVC